MSLVVWRTAGVSLRLRSTLLRSMGFRLRVGRTSGANQRSGGRCAKQVGSAVSSRSRLQS